MYFLFGASFRHSSKYGRLYSVSRPSIEEKNIPFGYCIQYNALIYCMVQGNEKSEDEATLLGDISYILYINIWGREMRNRRIKRPFCEDILYILFINIWGREIRNRRMTRPFLGRYIIYIIY